MFDYSASYVLYLQRPMGTRRVHYECRVYLRVKQDLNANIILAEIKIKAEVFGHWDRCVYIDNCLRLLVSTRFAWATY